MGWTVYATARQPATLDELAAAGCRMLALDVTDEESMQAARGGDRGRRRRADQQRRLLASRARSRRCRWTSVRRQFETNVFGLLRLTQLVLPGMRAAGAGKIVNVSSMGGRLTFPGGGAYHATKYAVEALSDALRMEVARFGIDVICVEPGLIRTEFGATAAGGVTRRPPTARTRSSTRRSRSPPATSTRARSRASAATPTTSRRRSRRRSASRARRPACRSPRPRGCSWACAACCPTAPGTRSSAVVQVSLERFVEAQDRVWPSVLAELRAGRKTSHWMWFVFPQLPGLGRSPMSVQYAIADVDEARAYLAHPVLGPRLRECAQILLGLTGLHRVRHLRRHRRAEAALLDDPLRRSGAGRPTLPRRPRALRRQLRAPKGSTP